MHRIATGMRLENVLVSESKNIIIVGPAYPLRGGLASYNQLLASNLQRQGHKVSILTFSLQYPEILFPGKTQFSEEEGPKDIDIDVALNSINPFNWLKHGKRIRREAPDLMILRYWMPFMAPCLGTLARTVKKNGKTRIVAITDNVIPHERRFFDTVLTKYFIGSCDAFVSMSRSVMEDLRSLNAQKPAYFNPHPMYEGFGDALSKAEARNALGLDVSGRYLLFFGFIRKYKGLDILLRSLAVMQHKDVKLIIAGEFYEDSAPYLKLINELGLGHRIELHTHFIADSKVREYFCACDMVVQTYKTATQSGVTQIAYYYDRPMLVTNVGGLAELVPHETVGYVCSVNEAEIAKSLDDFYQNEREEDFVDGVRSQRSRFSWSTMIETLLKA